MRCGSRNRDYRSNGAGSAKMEESMRLFSKLLVGTALAAAVAMPASAKELQKIKSEERL